LSRRAAVLSVVFAIAISSCTRPKNAVRIAVGGQVQLCYLPTTLAQQLGLYEQQGLHVTLQDFPGGSRALEALMGGSADVVSGFYDHTIQMAAEGRDLKSFVTMLRYPAFALIVSPVTSKSIHRIGDLKGAVVGVTAPGSSSHLFLNYLLSKNGLSPDDISATGVGATATAVAALVHGKVDAAVMTDPAIAQAQKRTPKLTMLADTRTAEGVKQAFGSATYPAAVLYSSGKWIQENRETAARLAVAIQRTLQWIQQHSPEQIIEKMPESFRGDDPTVAIEALRNSMPMFSADGLMDPQGAEAVNTVLSTSIEKVRQAKVKVSSTYTNEFLAGSK
jgi:NitT/TauT family transport system substrate-binding protein